RAAPDHACAVGHVAQGRLSQPGKALCPARGARGAAQPASRYLQHHHGTRPRGGSPRCPRSHGLYPTRPGRDHRGRGPAGDFAAPDRGREPDPAQLNGFAGSGIHAIIKSRNDREKGMDRSDKLTARIDGHEGRVIAHRRMFQKLLDLSSVSVWAQILRWLEDREVMADGQAEPGVISGPEATLDLALPAATRLLHDLAAASRSRFEAS